MITAQALILIHDSNIGSLYKHSISFSGHLQTGSLLLRNRANPEFSKLLQEKMEYHH